MKHNRIIRTAVALLALAGISFACNREYFEIKKITSDSINPTYAIPIADVEITIEQLVKRFTNDLENIYDPNYSTTTDSVFFLQIEYIDTLAPLAGPANALPAGTALAPIKIPLDSIELNLFGQLGGNEAFFRLINPSVRFTFLNSIDKAFELTFDTLYTRRTTDNQIFPFKVLDSSLPFQIGKALTTGAMMETSFTLSNENTESYTGDPNPLTNVIEPTPKYVYYASTLNPVGTDATAAGGQVQVISNVLLPLEGFGSFYYRDTVPFNLVDSGQADLVNEILLRMVFTNGLPLDAEVEVLIYDSTQWSLIFDVPIYDENGVLKPNGAFIEAAEVQGASNDFRPASPKKFFSDLKLTSTEFKQAVKGNVMVINAKLFTTDFDRTNANHLNSATVKMYTDYSLRVQMGLKTQLNIDPNNINN
jgi:hypothetical protein